MASVWNTWRTGEPFVQKKRSVKLPNPSNVKNSNKFRELHTVRHDQEVRRLSVEREDGQQQEEPRHGAVINRFNRARGDEVKTWRAAGRRIGIRIAIASHRREDFFNCRIANHRR